MRAKLNVISGSWIAATPWLDLPAEIEARSPFDRDALCMVRVGKGDAVKAAKNRLRMPIYEFWSVLHGEPPPVPNADLMDGKDLTRLTDAHACFRGLRRPCAEDDDGSRFVVFVIKPRHFFVHHPNPDCIASRREVPSDVVFTACVRLDAPCEARGPSSKGCLTHWQFVKANASGLLPMNAGTSHEAQLW